MKLQELRDAVRDQMELDEEDLSNSMIDFYVQEGYTEAIAAEQQWPFFEQFWEIPIPEGASRVPLPKDLAALASVTDQLTGNRLLKIAYEMAEDNRLASDSAGDPTMFSVWGPDLFLWPAAGTARVFGARGWRHPKNWVASGAGAVVDADERLHSTLVHYAVSRAYAQQEDDVLEQLYYGKFRAAFDIVRKAIMKPDPQRPLILNGGFGAGRRRLSKYWRLTI
jgi:hypothetical protein